MPSPSATLLPESTAKAAAATPEPATVAINYTGAGTVYDAVSQRTLATGPSALEVQVALGLQEQVTGYFGSGAGDGERGVPGPPLFADVR